MPILLLLVVLLAITVVIVRSKNSMAFLLFSLFVGLGVTIPFLPASILEPSIGAGLLMVVMVPVALVLVIIALIQIIKAIRADQNPLIWIVSLVFLTLPILVCYFLL